MKHWINRNYKTLIITAFLIPIITVAIVSISHVTQWYGISNPITWAVYLSVGIEIAAMSALAAISANMGRNVYFPFIVVTFIQFIGNIFFAYQYIDMTSPMFKSWVELVTPLVGFIGVEATDLIGHKRFISLFAGGLLPVISLSFLHMLVKFTEEDRLKDIKEEETKNHPTENTKTDIPIVVDEDIRLKLSDDELNRINEILSRTKAFVPPTTFPKTDQATDQVSDDIDDELNLIVPEETKTTLPKLSDLLKNDEIKSPGIFYQEKDQNIEPTLILPEPTPELDVVSDDVPPVGDSYQQYELYTPNTETSDNPPIVEETSDNPPIVEEIPLIKHEQDYFFGNDGLNTPANIETLPETIEEDKKKI